MQPELVFVVDLDECVAQYFAGLREHLLAKFPHRRPSKIPSSYDFSSDPSWGFTNRDDFLALHNEAVDHGLFANLEPIDGASEALWNLSNQGVWLRVLTHRLHAKGSHVRVVSDTVSWLDNNDVPYRGLCFESYKTDVGGDVYLEDSPANIEALERAGKFVITFDKPYNKHVGKTRAQTWLDVEAIVEELLHEKRKN